MERTATPVTGQPFLNYPAQFAMSNDVIHPLEARIIAELAVFKERERNQKEAIQAQAIQDAALEQILQSPQGQAAYSNQVRVI